MIPENITELAIVASKNPKAPSAYITNISGPRAELKLIVNLFKELFEKELGVEKANFFLNRFYKIIKCIVILI